MPYSIPAIPYLRLRLTLGSDGAGKIAALGSRVRRFQVGDAVYAYSFANPKGGFFFFFFSVASANSAHIPASLRMR